MQNSIAKTAIITGGSRGLGKEAALKIAAKGHDVIFTYHSNQQAAEEVVTSIKELGRKVASIQFDVSKVATFPAFKTQVETVLEEWGKTGFDFLVNNAGVGAYTPIGQTDEAAFDNLVNIQFKGVYFLTQTLLPLIQTGGRVINISTGLTRFALPGYAAYASMKGAIEVFTKYLAKELGSRGIGANLVAPGAIDNDFNKHAFDNNPEVRGFIAGQTALGRVGVSEDIGGVVAFLTTEDARWINAQRIEASGGMFL